MKCLEPERAGQGRLCYAFVLPGKGGLLTSTRMPAAIFMGLLGLALALPMAAHAAIEPPPESPIGGDHVLFETPDGVQLKGNVFRPKRGPVKGGILFVHEPFRSSRDWAYMAEKMSKHGFVAMVFDLRGHGASLMQGDEELDREMFGEEEFAAMAQDVQVALDALRAQADVPADKIHLAGADLGASLCLLHAKGDPGIRSVAMLSPGLGYDGINLVGTLSGLGSRPLMMVYSVEDGYARKSVEVLGKEATGPLHVETYYGVGHGAKMLAREPQLEVLMLSWFLGTVITEEGRALEDAGKPVTEDKEAVGTDLDATAERRRIEEARRDAESTEAGTLEDEDDGSRTRRWELDEEKQK